MTPVNLRLPDELITSIQALYPNATLSDSLRDALRQAVAYPAESAQQFEALLSRSRRHLRKWLSPEQIAAVADALNGTTIDPISLVSPVTPGPSEAFPVTSAIGAEVEDAMPELAEKWGLDGPSFCEKLAALSIVDTVALYDAVRRFWRRVGEGDNPDPRKLLEG